MKLLKVEAPSISAASYISAGIAWRPARKVIIQNGAPCQIVVISTEMSARVGSARNRIGASMKWYCIRKLLMIPLTSLYIHFQVYAATSAGIAQGRNINERQKCRALI